MSLTGGTQVVSVSSDQFLGASRRDQEVAYVFSSVLAQRVQTLEEARGVSARQEPLWN